MATLRGINEMLGIGWLPHQPLHGVDNVSTCVFHRSLVIVIPSQILKSVEFPLPVSLIIWHASHDLQDVIPVCDAQETRSSVFYLQQIVIVCLHALLRDPTLDIFLLFTRR